MLMPLLLLLLEVSVLAAVPVVTLVVLVVGAAVIVGCLVVALAEEDCVAPTEGSVECFGPGELVTLAKTCFLPQYFQNDGSAGAMHCTRLDSMP